MSRSWTEPQPVLRRVRLERSRQGAGELFAIVVRVVADAYGITRDQLAGPSRGVARVALARQVAMYLTSVIGDLDHAAVGRLFQRDRTTVSHACTIVCDRFDDGDFEHLVFLLEGIVERTRQMQRGADDAAMPFLAGDAPGPVAPASRLGHLPAGLEPILSGAPAGAPPVALGAAAFAPALPVRTSAHA